MKKLKWCLFCGTQHRRPNNEVCMAKGEVLRMYLEMFPKNQKWKVFWAVENGLIDMDREAKRLISYGVG